MNLTGARVLVTGASRGLGAELAATLAANGARLALVARSADSIAKLAAELGGNAYPADLTDVSGIDELVHAIEADGPIDVLVNNAGIDLTGRLTELEVDDVASLFAVNLVAPTLLCRAVLPGMLDRGQGHILNVSSIAGTNALPGLAPYSASKAGLSQFTAGLRADLRGTPITVTLAEIGPIESDMMDSLRSYGPTRRSLERLSTLRLSYDLPMAKVVQALVDAIERGRAHVRMPLRDAPFPIMVEAPRAITRILLAGVDNRSD